MSYILRQICDRKSFDTACETQELGIDIGDKLWHSLLKEDQDRIDSLFLIEQDEEWSRVVKVWKPLKEAAGD